MAAATKDTPVGYELDGVKKQAPIATGMMSSAEGEVKTVVEATALAW